MKLHLRQFMVSNFIFIFFLGGRGDKSDEGGLTFVNKNHCGKNNVVPEAYFTHEVGSCKVHLGLG